MRKWKVLGAILAVAFVVPSAFAQTSEDLMQELQSMKQRITDLEAQNQKLQVQVNSGDDGALESQINALVDRYAAGTTVKSIANPVTLTGEFRIRNTWSLGDTANWFQAVNAAGMPVAGITNTNPANPAQRNRFEHDGSYTDARVRLGFQYDFSRDVTAYAELQAHWAYGDFSSETGGFGAASPFAGPYGFVHGETANFISLYQGWIEVRNIFGRPEFSSRSGRQEIVLGNQFQFGNADWYNGWTFDASRWDWDQESFSLTVLFAKLSGVVDRDINQVGSAWFTSHDHDELVSVYFTLKTIEHHKLDLYWIYVNGHGIFNANGSLGNTIIGGYGQTGASNAYYHTVGARIGGVFPSIAAGLDWNVEGAYQFGDVNNAGAFPGAAGAIRDVDGWTVEAEVGLTFNREHALRIYVRFLYAQGPDQNDTGYITLFPNRHSNTGFRARYGIADLIPMTNVITVQGGIHFDPDPSWTLGLSVIWATTENDNSLLNTADDDYGWEIDVWGEYRYSEQLTFGIGVALVFPDDEGAVLWGIDDGLEFMVYLQARLIF